MTGKTKTRRITAGDCRRRHRAGTSRRCWQRLPPCGRVARSRRLGSVAPGASSARKPHEAEVPFVAIQTGKLRRYLSWQTPIDLVRVPWVSPRRGAHLASLQPDVVFSTGGYVAVPTALAAARRGIPVLTHEQTAQLGLATRIICRVADVLALSFPMLPEGAKVGRARVVHTGNPVRPELFGGDAAAGRLLSVFHPTFRRFTSRAARAARRRSTSVSRPRCRHCSHIANHPCHGADRSERRLRETPARS